VSVVRVGERHLDQVAVVREDTLAVERLAGVAADRSRVGRVARGDVD